MNVKEVRRKRRHMHILKKIHGTTERPRMIVYRSNKHLYLQVIDDEEQKVITGISTLSKEFQESYKGSTTKSKEAAAHLAALMAEKCKKLKISKIVFDRNGYKYHGRVKVLADTLREKGLNF